MNENKANFDPGQIYNNIYDGKLEALRVSVVDGITLSDVKIENINIPEIEKQVIIKEIQIERIEVPVIIKEIQVERVEIPVVIKEIEVREVEKLVYVPEIKIIEVEKPIVIKEIEIKEIEKQIYSVPMIAKVCMVIQALALVGILLTKAM
tara:strand:+ start:764 stop:1213 length:450 start_codon:yes stop_codon:yes gene_type:complete